MEEVLRSITFTINVRTNTRNVSKVGASWEELETAIDDLACEGLCPFGPDSIDYEDDSDEDEATDEDTDLDDAFDLVPEKEDSTPPNHEA